MSKTVERLNRVFLDIKGSIGKATRNDDLRNDAVVFEIARKIGIAIQLSGKAIQEAAEEGKYLDVAYFLTQTKSVAHTLSHILDTAIVQDFDEIAEAKPEDFQ